MIPVAPINLCTANIESVVFLRRFFGEERAIFNLLHELDCGRSPRWDLRTTNDRFLVVPQRFSDTVCTRLVECDRKMRDRNIEHRKTSAFCDSFSCPYFPAPYFPAPVFLPLFSCPCFPVGCEFSGLHQTVSENGLRHAWRCRWSQRRRWIAGEARAGSSVLLTIDFSLFLEYSPAPFAQNEASATEK